MSKFPPVTANRLTPGTKGEVKGVGVISPPVKGLVLLTAGDATVKSMAGDNLPFVGLPAGYVFPFVITEIVALANGATAATIDDY